MDNSEQRPWGRVDESGTVYVREGDTERVVGQFLDGTPEEAMAYFQRKYLDLEGQVSLLEQRAKRGAPVADIATTASKLRTAVVEANAVGDLACLSTRVDALLGTVQELTEQHKAEAQAEIARALASRQIIVEEIEALASTDPATIQWKSASATLDELFTKWQEHQRSGPRLPKADADELWKRFRAARSTIEHGRKTFFANLDNQHRDVRERKSALIDEAEKLLPRGADATSDYRRLLDEWKLAGRAGKKNDDVLWNRFKAIGDQIYAAKTEIDARDNEEYEANLKAKLALLEEAEPILTEKDRVKARSALRTIQEKWDSIGRVPRDQVKNVEDRLRKIEATLRRREEEHWEKNNPEKQARSQDLANQLSNSITQLESELAAARESGSPAAIVAAQEALETRRAWLEALSSH